MQNTAAAGFYNFNFFPDTRELVGTPPHTEQFVGVICASKGSGKTTLLIHLIKSVWRNKFDNIIIVSPTFSLQDLSREIDFGNGVVIFSEFRQSIIEEIIKLQIEKIEDRKAKIELYYQGEIEKSEIPSEHHVLLVFDDIGNLGREGKLAIELTNLSFLVRHYKLSIIELAQRATLLTTGLSSQADFYIFFAECNPNERVNIFKRTGFGPNKKAFFRVFDRETMVPRSWIGIRKICGRNLFFNCQGFLEVL